MAEDNARTMLDDLMERAEEVQAEDLRFGRHWFYLMASVLAWGLFWEMADRNHDNPHAQYLAWMAVFVAFWLADRL